MPANRQKLELTWVGKDERPRLEPRILRPDDARSHHAPFRNPPLPANSPLPEGEAERPGAESPSGRSAPWGSGVRADHFDNRLIFGDNLLALKALEQEFAGRIKCVFIDPPYNTGSAFTHYDDGLEHSLWLTMMRDRLELLRNLLSDDGSIWITIDDNEAHYLKVLCDEIFGRVNFVATFIWKKVDSPNDNKVPITPDHEYVLCYSKNADSITFNQKQDPTILAAYRPPDNESERPYRDRLLKKNGKNSLRTDRPSMYFAIPDPDGIEVLPIHDDGREACWALGKNEVFRLLASGEIVWKQRERNGQKVWVPYTREYAPDSPKRPWQTIWSDLDTSRQTKAHHKQLFDVEVSVFDTPKPENLVERVLLICTNPGDWVLDSFAGSGTTGAVAHKMGRRWIMIELGEHCHTHIIPRLQKVIDGADQGGISKAVNWRGGGGFRYYTLAPSLLAKDKWGNWVINAQYAPAMLAEAVCKLEGFTYAPSDSAFWQHGHSTERDFIYVTTQTLTREQLAFLSEEVGRERTLLACCGAVRAARTDEFDNLTVKKIPQAVLDKCEYGHDDYSLAVAALPPAEPDAGQISLL